jgi:hypothetical protein
MCLSETQCFAPSGARNQIFQLSRPMNISPLMGRRLQPPKCRLICCTNFRVRTLGKRGSICAGGGEDYFSSRIICSASHPFGGRFFRGFVLSICFYLRYCCFEILLAPARLRGFQRPILLVFVVCFGLCGAKALQVFLGSYRQLDHAFQKLIWW